MSHAENGKNGVGLHVKQKKNANTTNFYVEECNFADKNATHQIQLEKVHRKTEEGMRIKI
jgi:hypothetical protein